MLGLPQGGVLSCLLFNLFIESLSTFIESHPKIKGVEITSPAGIIRLIHMLFADDMAALATTRGELVTLVELIDEWCTAHGLTISVSGTDKSAFMHMTLVFLPRACFFVSLSTNCRTPNASRKRAVTDAAAPGKVEPKKIGNYGFLF